MNAKTKEETKPADVAKPATDVALRSGGTAVVVAEDYGDDAGKGMENIAPDERKVPFVRILQSNSPQCTDDGNAKYMPHAKAGMFINTSTNQLYDKLVVIPCARDHKFVEYTPRVLGGGFVAIYEPKDEIVLRLRAEQGKFGRLARNITRRDNQGQPLDGTEIIEGFQLYCIFIDPETDAKFRGVLAFQSTQIQKYTTFIDRYDSIQYRTSSDDNAPLTKPPMWAHKWLMTTANEKNKKGAFKGYVIGLLAKKPDGSDDVPVKSLIKRSDPLYAEGKAFFEFVEAGKAEADYATDAKAAPKAAPKAEDEVKM